MAEYIEREALYKWVLEFYPHDLQFASAVLNAPAAKVAEVRHGKWETDKEDLEWGNALKKKHCSVCNTRAIWDKGTWEFILTEYCPHCGAKMDLEV